MREEGREGMREEGREAIVQRCGHLLVSKRG